MAYIYKRGKYFWVGWKEGGQSFQKSLNVSSRDAAKTLLAEYQHREARSRHKSTLLIINKDLSEAVEEYIEIGNAGRSKETIRERKGALNRLRSVSARGQSFAGSSTVCPAVTGRSRDHKRVKE